MDTVEQAERLLAGQTLLRPVRLKVVRRSGAGWEINAFVPKEVDCAEFTLRATYQPILQEPRKFYEECVGYAPFIQFPPKEWDEMIGEMFTEMVELWNAKHAATGSSVTHN